MRMYNEGYEGRSVREVGGNAYVVAGGTDLHTNWHWHMRSPIASTHVHLFKTDASGLLLWEKIFRQPGERTIATWMEPTADGGHIITGQSDHDVVWPPDSNNVILLKTDGAGNLQWSWSFDTGKDEIANCVRPTSDGGYIISGFHDAVPTSYAGTTRVLLIKTDALGAVVWSQKYELGIRDIITGEPFTYVVRPLADGGFAIVGTAVGTLALGVYVIRTDALGGVTWAKVYYHDPSVLRHSTGLDILESATGELIVAGSMDKTQPMETNYPYVMRLGADGTLADARFYETAPLLFFQSGFSSVIQTIDGGFFFTGMGGYGEFGDQMQLLKTSADLTTQWSRVYTWDGVATMGSRSGRPTSDGGYVFTGKRQMAGTVLMKSDGVGLIPCKVPNVLVERLPSVLTLDVTPASVPGIVATPTILLTTSPLVDLAEICPESFPLPVELVSFTATALPEGSVEMRWLTASETDNDHFVIERSADAIAFTAVARVDGAGNSQTSLHYAHTDHDPLLVEISYYRLVQVDHDGAETPSDIVAVVLDRSALAVVSTRAEPAANTIHVQVRNDREEALYFTLRDMMGRIVEQGACTAADGVRPIELRAGHLRAGMYSFSVTNGMRVAVARVVY